MFDPSITSVTELQTYCNDNGITVNYNGISDFNSSATDRRDNAIYTWGPTGSGGGQRFNIIYSTI